MFDKPNKPSIFRLTGAPSENMNSQDYKRMCDQPDVLSEAYLKQSKTILQRNSAPELTVIDKSLETGLVEPPEKHNQKSSAHSRYYRVVCTSEQANNIAEFLHDAEAHSVTSSGTATSETNLYGALGDAWDRLADFI